MCPWWVNVGKCLALLFCLMEYDFHVDFHREMATARSCLHFQEFDPFQLKFQKNCSCSTQVLYICTWCVQKWQNSTSAGVPLFILFKLQQLIEVEWLAKPRKIGVSSSYSWGDLKKDNTVCFIQSEITSLFPYQDLHTNKKVGFIWMKHTVQFSACIKVLWTPSRYFEFLLLIQSY